MADAIGLLLAAGAGRRMGRPKALVEGSDGTPWVIHGVRTLADGGCTRVTVVVGAQALQVAELLADEPVTVVTAADWAEGMGASLRAGLTAIGEDRADAAVIHLVDLPDVGPAVVRRLIARAAPDVVARASYGPGERHGHPVLLGREHWSAAAAQCAGDTGARAYLSQREVALVDCADLASGRDIDTAEQIGHPAERAQP